MFQKFVAVTSTRNGVVYKTQVKDMGCINFVTVSGALVSRDMRVVFSGSQNAKEFCLPASCEVIEKSAFEMMRGRGISTVVCPEGLRSICDNAFFCCESLKKIVFRDGSRLEHIGKQAFSQTSIREFVAPASLQKIDRNAFYLCSQLKRVSLNDALEEIGQKCFASTSIADIHIPSRISELPTDAFLGCSNLETVTFAENSNLRRVGTEAFAKSGLKTFEAPLQLEEIGQAAFFGCKKLSQIQLNDCLTVIGAGDIPYNMLDGMSVFGETALKCVLFPASLRRIEQYAFLGLSSLRTVEFKEGVEVFGRGCFSNTGLEKVALPKSLTDISEKAFEGCKNLRSLEIPPKGMLRTIGMRAFADTALTEFKAPDGLECLKREAFAGARQLRTVTLN